MVKILTPSFSDLTGFLLIASPRLAESFFAQSVIYIFNYSKKGGASGVIINKRLANFTSKDVFKNHNTRYLKALPRLFLGVGGPVEMKRIFVVHTPFPDEETSSKKIGPARLSSDSDMLYDLTNGRGPEHAFIVLGYAGWAQGQLETEILRNHYWLLAPATKKLIFETESNQMWEKSLASLGMTPAFLSGEKGES